MQDYFYNLIELEKVKGTNAKKEILKKYEENVTFKYILEFLFNPYKTTGISTKKINKQVHTSKDDQSITTSEFKNIIDVLDYLVLNNTGKDMYIYFIQQFLNTLPHDEIEIVKKIITKKYVLGIDISTINKVWKNYIPEFKVMLAHKYQDNIEYLNGKNFTITRKMDSERCIVFRNNNDVKLFARSGKQFLGFTELENEIRKLPINKFVLDCEILIKNWRELNSADCYKLSSNIIRKKGEKTGVAICVFDFINFEEWMCSAPTAPYSSRREMLDKYFKGKSELINVLPVLYNGTYLNVIPKILEEQEKLGQEGLMINTDDATYQFKRTKDLLKVKSYNEDTFEIVDMQEGTSKYKGLLGALIIKYKDSTVAVGSGFSDEQRKEFWENKDKLIGKKCDVKYFEETTSNGIPSLRFPVFLKLREDK